MITGSLLVVFQFFITNLGSIQFYPHDILQLELELQYLSTRLKMHQAMTPVLLFCRLLDATNYTYMYMYTYAYIDTVKLIIQNEVHVNQGYGSVIEV